MCIHMYLCMPVEGNLRCCSLSSTLFETKSLVLHLPFCCRNTDFKHSLLCLGLHTVLAIGASWPKIESFWKRGGPHLEKYLH